MPFRNPWRHIGTGQIGFLMTVGTLEGVFALTVRPALDALRMRTAVIGLERHIARRVAVHAARVQQNLVCLCEWLASTGIILLALGLSDVGMNHGRDSTVPCPFELINRKH